MTTTAPPLLLRLFCLVIDNENNATKYIGVNATGDSFVIQLNDTIHKNLGPVGDHFEPHELKVWKVLHHVASMDVYRQNEGLNEFMAQFNNNSASVAQEMFPFCYVSKYFDAIPTEGELHMIIQIPVSQGLVGRKRKREESSSVARDVSLELLERWQTPFSSLPSLIDLQTHLNRPLASDEKIPISNEIYTKLLIQHSETQQSCLPSDLDTLFRITEEEAAFDIQLQVASAITTGPPLELGTENSFIHLWDHNIGLVLLKCLGESYRIRDSNKDTATGAFRPGFGLLIDGRCIFRGEEKKPSYTGTSPREKLIKKTRWVYGSAPYVIGYYAVGTEITLVTVEHDPSQRHDGVSVWDILTTNLSTRRGRINNIRKMIRLVPVICSLAKMISKGVDADMLPMPRDDGKSIEFFKAMIRKNYSLKDTNRVIQLQNIYKLLAQKQVPNVDRLRKANVVDECYVKLVPRGNDEGPRSVDDVKRAVTCVLEALEVLHTKPKIFHRDIRWLNVMQSREDPTRWFLIDWEDATQEPTEAAPHLRSGTHAPQVFADGHGAEVDIWGVGRLITTAGIHSMPKDLISLGERMMDGSIKSATQALEELKNL